MLPKDTTTRVVAAPDLESAELAERIALFALVQRHPRASKVLEGLSATHAAAATKLIATAMAWPSSKRHARAALEFGLRGDQHARLALVVAEAPPPLRVALVAEMASAQQARFPKLVNQEVRRVPGRAAFAARLVREATR